MHALIQRIHALLKANETAPDFLPKAPPVPTLVIAPPVPLAKAPAR